MKRTNILSDIVRNRRHAVNVPRYLTYIVTWTCNARCIMCDCWKKDSPDDLSIGEIEGLYRQLPKMDAVRLTGGEPFVRKDFGEIASLTEAFLKPSFLHVTTNGFLTDRIVKFCETRKRTTPLRLLVSMDGLEDKHNHVRGRTSAWATTSATVQALAPRQKELNIHLSVNQTIVDAEGMEQYRQLRNFLRPLGVQVNVVMAYDASATYSLKHDTTVAESQIGQFTTFGDFEVSRIGEFVDEIEEDLQNLPWADRVAKRYYWKGVRGRVLHQGKSPNPSCVALNSHMRLYPNGDIPVCQFNARRVGNIRRQTFKEVWFGEEIDSEREWVRKCPGCWAECEVLPNAVYTGDLVLNAVIG
jgi:Fe-coproporphyrin III synthase